MLELAGLDNKFLVDTVCRKVVILEFHPVQSTRARTGIQSAWVSRQHTPLTRMLGDSIDFSKFPQADQQFRGEESLVEATVAARFDHARQ